MHGMRRTLAAAAAALTLFALVACTGANPYGGGTTAPAGGGSTGAASGGNTITLQNIAFNPSSLTVKVGDTVTFKNADQAPHHIVVGTTDLGEQQPGQDTTWKAPADGVYMLKCLIHPSMSGQITVGAGGSTVGTPAAGGSMPGGGGSTPGY